MFFGNVLRAVLDQSAEIDVVRPVGAGRDLIEAGFIQIVEPLHVDAFGRVEFLAVVPVALKHVFRHPFEEFFLMMPAVI